MLTHRAPNGLLFVFARGGEVSARYYVERNAVVDDKDRITATVTSDGDRTAIPYDLTDS